MRYHIDTGLLIEEFKRDSECPFCNLKAKLEEQFLYEFLNDAVMEDETRALVNKVGFCDKHFDMLFLRPNKISIALQSVTRLNSLNKIIKVVKDKKQAVKQAGDLEKSTNSCVICELVDESMKRYFDACADLFKKNQEFKSLVKNCKGFCLAHYKTLILSAKGNKAEIEEFLTTTSSVQNKNVERLIKELQWFCDKHDYRNANKPLGTSEDAIPRTRVKLYGKKQV